MDFNTNVLRDEYASPGHVNLPSPKNNLPWNTTKCYKNESLPSKSKLRPLKIEIMGDF